MITPRSMVYPKVTPEDAPSYPFSACRLPIRRISFIAVRARQGPRPCATQPAHHPTPIPHHHPLSIVTNPTVTIHQPNRLHMANPDRPHKLITVPYSHYCDRARWALDLAQANYQEDKWPPLFHLLATKRTKRGKSVPILVTSAGEEITDSADIVKWVARTYPAVGAQLYPDHLTEQIDRWEATLSKRLGPMVRVVLYHHLFREPVAVYSRTLSQSMSSRRAWWFRLLMRPIIGLIKRGYKVNEENAANCTKKIHAIFADVSEALSDGRPFLVAGSTAPTAADITFAALASPLLGVPNYGGRLQLKVPPFASPEWPGNELAATPAAKHVLRLYKECRLQLYGKQMPSAQA